MHQQPVKLVCVYMYVVMCVYVCSVEKFTLQGGQAQEGEARLVCLCGYLTTEAGIVFY